MRALYSCKENEEEEKEEKGERKRRFFNPLPQPLLYSRNKKLKRERDFLPIISALKLYKEFMFPHAAIIRCHLLCGSRGFFVFLLLLFLLLFFQKKRKFSKRQKKIRAKKSVLRRGLLG